MAVKIVRMEKVIICKIKTECDGLHNNVFVVFSEKALQAKDQTVHNISRHVFCLASEEDVWS